MFSSTNSDIRVGVNLKITVTEKKQIKCMYMFVCIQIKEKTTTQKLKASSNNKSRRHIIQHVKRDKFQSETAKSTGRRLRMREREREKLIAAAWQQQSHHEAKHTCTHTLTARPTFCFYYRAQQSRLFACCCCCCRRALINEIIIIRDVGPLSLRLSLFAFNRDTLKVANTKSTKK